MNYPRSFSAHTPSLFEGEEKGSGAGINELVVEGRQSGGDRGFGPQRPSSSSNRRTVSPTDCRRS